MVAHAVRVAYTHLDTTILPTHDSGYAGFVRHAIIAELCYTTSSSPQKSI
jgi:hypothetical protein